MKKVDDGKGGFMRKASIANILGKGNISLKLTSGKIVF